MTQPNGCRMSNRVDLNDETYRKLASAIWRQLPFDNRENYHHQQARLLIANEVIIVNATIGSSNKWLGFRSRMIKKWCPSELFHCQLFQRLKRSIPLCMLLKNSSYNCNYSREQQTHDSRHSDELIKYSLSHQHWSPSTIGTTNVPQMTGV